MHVLVTGGAGYVGSHVVRALRRAGHRCTALDDLSTGHRALADAAGAELVVGDAGDARALDSVLGRGVDAVVHLAGRAIVAESVRDPGPYFRVNVVAGLALLEGLARHGVPRLVFSSSCAVYGAPASQPVSEACVPDPISPYGASKLAFEQAIAAWCRAHGLRALSLRYFNVAGAADEGDLGERHAPETHLVPCALRAAAGGPPVEVCGTDYPTRDGTAERDYLHVLDVAAAHVAALERLDDLPEARAGAALNLGAQRGATVREVLAAAERVTGRAVPTRAAPRRPGDPPALVADAARAARVLSFKAERDLDAMVRSAWRFERSSEAARSREIERSRR